MVRLFVGGLPNDVTEAQLKERFKAFGDVTSVTLPPPKSAGSRDSGDLEVHRGFAYLELTAQDASAVRRCLNAYNGCIWRGGTLRVEEAKPSYLDRLHADWAAQQAAAEKVAAERAKRKLQSVAAGVLPVPDKPRPLHILRPDGRKTMRVEPGRPKRYFPVARPIPLDRLPWTMPDPPKPAGPSSTPVVATAPKPSVEARGAAVPPPAALRGPPAGDAGPSPGPGRGEPGAAEGGERKRGERAARRALKSLLGDDLDGTDSDTGRDNPKRLRAVDFTTKDDLPQSLPAGPNADRFDSSDDDDDSADASPPRLPLRARGVGVQQQTPHPATHPSQTRNAVDPPQQTRYPDLHPIGPRGEGDLGARRCETERGDKHTSTGPLGEAGVQTHDREATRVLRTSDGLTGMGPHDDESSGDDRESDPYGAESSGDDLPSGPCDGDSSEDDSASDHAGGAEREAGPGEASPGGDLGIVSDGEEQGCEQGQRHEQGATDHVGPMWAKVQPHNDNAIVPAGALSLHSERGVDASHGDELAGAEADSEATHARVQSDIDALDNGGAAAADGDIVLDVVDDGNDDEGDDDDEDRHSAEAVHYDEDDDDEDDRSVVDEEHGGLEAGRLGDSLHSRGPQQFTATQRGRLAAGGGATTDEHSGPGDIEGGSGDVMSAHVDGMDTHHMTAGLAEAFPLGAGFWAGGEGARRAKAAWQAQRVTLLADYKRKRRDSVRHMPKRQRR